MSKHALLLNADWQPLHFINENDAIQLLYLNKAEIVTINVNTNEPSIWPKGHKLVSGKVFPAGATLRLNQKVNKSWQIPKFQKRILFNRDNWKCQYCGKIVNTKSATVEHIIPVSKGGETSWTNCITACVKCNRKKKDRTPLEAGMKLLSEPKMPTVAQYWNNSLKVLHPDWNIFLNI